MTDRYQRLLHGHLAQFQVHVRPAKTQHFAAAHPGRGSHHKCRVQAVALHVLKESAQLVRSPGTEPLLRARFLFGRISSIRRGFAKGGSSALRLETLGAAWREPDVPMLC